MNETVQVNDKQNMTNKTVQGKFRLLSRFFMSVNLIFSKTASNSIICGA